MRPFFIFYRIDIMNNVIKKGPSGELFGRIISAIRREEEMRRSKRKAISFLLCFAVSAIIAPISFSMLPAELERTGFIYYVSTAISDLGVFMVLWKDFSLAIIESLPLLVLAICAMSIVAILFTLRMFLRDRKVISGYLISQGHLLTI
jgi:hypothetical protein